MMYARRGTFISSSLAGFNAFDQDSEEDYETAEQGGFEAGEKMRLFDCGHAFHVQCILKHARERAE